MGLQAYRCSRVCGHYIVTTMALPTPKPGHEAMKVKKAPMGL